MITTTPVFYYIDNVTASTNGIDFLEPNKAAIEITGVLRVGAYSMTQLIIEVTRALNAAGQNTYSYSFDRSTRQYTVLADDDFNLLGASGSASGISILPVLGFPTDRTGAATYLGDVSGNEYIPQFLLQSFQGFETGKMGIKPSRNESASGEVEVVTFGTKRTMSFNMRYITDYFRSKSNPITNNPNGVADAVSFMDSATSQAKIEFMKDKESRSVFDTALLEKTPEDSMGVGYRLKTMRSFSLQGFYETGTLKFRKL